MNDNDSDSNESIDIYEKIYTDSIESPRETLSKVNSNEASNKPLSLYEHKLGAKGNENSSLNNEISNLELDDTQKPLSKNQIRKQRNRNAKMQRDLNNNSSEQNVQSQIINTDEATSNPQQVFQDSRRSSISTQVEDNENQKPETRRNQRTRQRGKNHNNFNKEAPSSQAASDTLNNAMDNRSNLQNESQNTRRRNDSEKLKDNQNQRPDSRNQTRQQNRNIPKQFRNEPQVDPSNVNSTINDDEVNNRRQFNARKQFHGSRDSNLNSRAERNPDDATRNSENNKNQNQNRNTKTFYNSSLDQREQNITDTNQLFNNLRNDPAFNSDYNYASREGSISSKTSKNSRFQNQNYPKRGNNRNHNSGRNNNGGSTSNQNQTNNAENTNNYNRQNSAQKNQPNDIQYKEIVCNELIIFKMLSFYKDFYAKDWNVNLELLSRVGLIKLSSTQTRPLERLYESILNMIKNFIKFNLEYENDAEAVNLIKHLKTLKSDYRDNKKEFTFLYQSVPEGKILTIALTWRTNEPNNEIEILKKEIESWNLGYISSNEEYLLISNFKSGSENIIKLHLSNILNIHEAELKYFTIEDFLLLKYIPKISFQETLEKHQKIILYSEQIKDIRLEKIPQTNKLIIDSINLDNTDSIKTYLEVENEIIDFDIQRLAYGLFVVTFNNKSDKGYLQNQAHIAEQKIDNERLLILPFHTKILDTLKNVKDKVENMKKEEEKRKDEQRRRNAICKKYINIDDKLFFALKDKKREVEIQFGVKITINIENRHKGKKIIVEGKNQNYVMLCVEYIERLKENAKCEYYEADKYKTLLKNKISEIMSNKDDGSSLLFTNFHVPQNAESKISVFATSGSLNGKELVSKFFDKLVFKVVTERHVITDFNLLSDKLNDIKSQSNIELAISNDNINNMKILEFIGEPNDIQTARTLIRNILTNNKIVMKTFYPKNKRYLVITYLKNFLNGKNSDRFNELFETNGVDYELIEQHNGIRFQCKSSELNQTLNKIVQKIENIENMLAFKTLSLTANLYRYLKESNKTVLLDVEEKNQVKIFYPKQQLKPVMLFENKSTKLKWFICSGNIVNSGTDAIVSSVNSSMESNSGVAKAIADAAGNDYVHDCQTFTKPLNQNDIYLTTAGKISSERILHVVCSAFRSDSTLDDLKKLYSSCIRICDNEKYSSISFPLIGAGIYNWPIDQSINALMKTITEIKNTSSLKRIYLVEYDEQILKDIVTCVTTFACSYNLDKITSSIKLDTSTKKTWYWFDDDKQWKQFRAEFIIKINSQLESGKPIFDMKIDSKNYQIDLIKKRQINLDTAHVRSISDSVPVVQVAQWYWIDHGKEVAYNLKNNAEIEDAFIKRQAEVKIQLKRHNDDKDCNYVINFASLKQKNENTGYKRDIVRKTNLENAKIIVEPEDDDDNEINENFLIDFRIGGEKNKVQFALQELFGKVQALQATDTIKNCNISTISIDKWKENKFKIVSNLPALKLRKQFVQIAQIGNDVVFESKIKADISEVKDLVFSLLLKSKSVDTIEYPREWTEINSNVLLVDVNRLSNEWKEIETEFNKTTKQKTITSIQRIQNKSMWKTYHDEKLYIQGKRGNLNEKHLWHGTRTTKPQCIYEGDKNGFDYRYSGQGMWGQGIYFAENASYSDNYAHSLNVHAKQFFYCNVILGDCTAIPSNPDLRLPPAKDPKADPTKLRVDRYDSVEGLTGGSRVFIIYENSKAYPAYLITYIPM